jgi:hypothetical protein
VYIKVKELIAWRGEDDLGETIQQAKVFEFKKYGNTCLWGDCYAKLYY